MSWLPAVVSTCIEVPSRKAAKSASRGLFSTMQHNLLNGGTHQDVNDVFDASNHCLLQCFIHLWAWRAIRCRCVLVDLLLSLVWVPGKCLISLAGHQQVQYLSRYTLLGSCPFLLGLYGDYPIVYTKAVALYFVDKKNCQSTSSAQRMYDENGG